MPGPTRCFFGNTFLSRGFDFTFTPGVTPSVCMLYTVPHVAELPNVGNLVFQTEGEPPFVFRDCLVEDPRLVASEQGQHWTLPIKDRRWMWQWGFIHGRYNVPKPDGSLIRERTPQQLAGLLLDAMGESGYDVSRLPNGLGIRPERFWDGHNPAAELDRLCAELGCIVVLNPFTDRVELWPVGEGSALPGGPTRGLMYAPVYPAQPQKVRAEAGYTRFQATFATEAVGLDVDGKWKPIHSLSYAPAGGWGFEWPPGGFPRFLDSQTYQSGGRTLKIRDLAEATVFRSYRITGLANGGWSVPLLQGTPLQSDSLKDLQLTDELVDEELSGVDGGLRPLPAVAYAQYWRELKAPLTTPTRYPHGFSFDSTHGIITFGEPLFQRSTITSGAIIPAIVRYECAFHAGKDGVFHRHSVEGGTGSTFATPVRLVQRNEISLRMIYRYANDNTFTASSNTAGTQIRLEYWRDAARDEYGLQNGGTVNYQQLMRISPDGLTQQVSWSGGGQRPPRTVVSQAQRHNRYVVPLNEYRDRLAAKRAEALTGQLVFLPVVRQALGGAI